MPKKLILIRHAQAEAGGASDFDRHLTQEGQRDARYVGQWILDKDLKPEMFYTSTAIRASETTAAITEVLGLSNRAQEISNLYEASVRTFLREIKKVNEDFQNVVFVGHNPTITYLAEYVSGYSVNNMTPGGLVLLQLEVETWKEVGEKSTAFIQYFSPE